MRPFDPRLIRYASATRGFLVASVVTGLATTALIIIQAIALTNIVVPVFTDDADLAAVQGAVTWLAIAVALRIAVAYASERFAFASSAKAKSQLRMGVINALVRLGPVWQSTRSSSELTQLVTRGVDGLDAYFSRYLPQLVLAVMVPLGVGVVILTQDVLAAVIVACTVPLIPVFMILIGLYTQRRVDRQWRSLSRLSGHFVDVVAGMSTLKIFGRAAAQARNVQRVGDEYRSTTMGVLRISFLSALVLELLAMLSVALVAVSIGLRLVNGTMTLEAGLLVLILVPEVYLPLRMVGVHFHAAAEGLGAADQMISILEEEAPRSGPRTDIPNLRDVTLRFDHVHVQYLSRDTAAIEDFSATISPRALTVICGPSGAGKSTLLLILERFLDASSGHIWIEGGSDRPDNFTVDISEFDVASWREQVAWVAQSPGLVSGSIADNVRLARPDASDSAVRSALARVDLLDFVDQLPAGIHTLVGEGQLRVSAGQQRRIALASVFCQPNAGLVLLDEPTASLDRLSEEIIVRAIEVLAETRTVVAVAHREALTLRADATIDLGLVTA